MCFPVAAMVAATVLSAVVGIGQAQGQRAAGKAEQQIAENNARLSEQQGKDAAILGARDSEQAAWRTRAMIGTQKAAIAANGLDMDVGTPLDILGQTALFGGADQSAIAMDAARKAWGFNAEALNYRNQGAQARWQGNQASKLTILSTLGSTLNSFGSMKFGSGPSLSTAGGGSYGAPWAPGPGYGGP